MAASASPAAPLRVAGQLEPAPASRSSKPCGKSSSQRARSSSAASPGTKREVKQLRDRAQRELDRLDAVWTRFKNLKVQDLEGDEVLYRR